MERENLERLDHRAVANAMARAGAGSPNDQAARAEFQRRQTEFQERQALAAEEAARAAERQATAAERASDATVSYTRFTRGLLVASVITAIAAVIALFLD